MFRLAPALKKRRLLRCRYLLNHFRTREQISKILFTDEKIFSFTPPKNSHNDRLCVLENERRSDIPLDRLLREREKFSSYVMVSAGICRGFKTGIIFINQGIRLNSQRYCELVLSSMLPQISDVMPDFMLMQVNS